MNDLNAENGPIIISTVMATFNSAFDIEAAIKSFLEQDFEQKELIIVDGGSTDDTVKIARSFRSPRMSIISERDNGIYDAWNKGIKIARGSWIHFLGSDDQYFDSHVLTAAVKFLDEVDENTTILATSTKIVRGHFNYIASPRSIEAVTDSLLKASTLENLPHPGCYHRRSAFEKFGFFDDRFKIAGDNELLIRWILQSKFAIAPAITSVCMQANGVSAKLGSSFRSARELRNARIKNKLPWRFPFLLTTLRFYGRGSLCRVLGEDNARKTIDILKGALSVLRHRL